MLNSTTRITAMKTCLEAIEKIVAYDFYVEELEKVLRENKVLEQFVTKVIIDREPYTELTEFVKKESP